MSIKLNCFIVITLRFDLRLEINLKWTTKCVILYTDIIITENTDESSKESEEENTSEEDDASRQKKTSKDLEDKG